MHFKPFREGHEHVHSSTVQMQRESHLIHGGILGHCGIQGEEKTSLCLKLLFPVPDD